MINTRNPKIYSTQETPKTKPNKTKLKKLAPYGTAVDYWERRCHLANVIAIAKAFAN